MSSIEDTLSLWIANSHELYFALEEYKDDPSELRDQLQEYLWPRLSERDGFPYLILMDLLNDADWDEVVKHVYSD